VLGTITRWVGRKWRSCGLERCIVAALAEADTVINRRKAKTDRIAVLRQYHTRTDVLKSGILSAIHIRTPGLLTNSADAIGLPSSLRCLIGRKSGSISKHAGGPYVGACKSPCSQRPRPLDFMGSSYAARVFST